jgi:branched-chain amino acid transport system permease protein
MNNAAVTPIAIGAGIVALLALLPLFADGYGLSLGIGVLNYAVLATAWAMFSGPTRYISLATVAFYGVGAYTVAVLGELLPWPLVLLSAGAIGTLLALAIGFSTMRLAGAYFVIFTFGLTELIRQLVTWYEVNVTRTIGRYVFLDITQDQIYWQLLALGAALFLLAFLIQRSRLGFKLRLIGGDETLARHVGIDVTRVKVSLFVLSTLFMTLTGAIMAPRWTYIDPNIAFNAVVSFEVVIMALLGGVQRLWGPLLGVIPLTLLFEYLNAYFPNHFSLILGLVFLVIVYLLPQGVAGLLAQNGHPAALLRRLKERAI